MSLVGAIVLLASAKRLRIETFFAYLGSIPLRWGLEVRQWGSEVRQWGLEVQFWGSRPRNWGSRPRNWGSRPQF